MSFMSKDETTAEMRERLEQEAVVWHARLSSGEMTPEQRVQFEQWKNLSAGHAKAHRKIQRLWQLLPSALDDRVTAAQSEALNASALLLSSTHSTADLGTFGGGRPSNGKISIFPPERSKPPVRTKAGLAKVSRWGLGLAMAASLLLIINAFCFDYLQHPFADYRTLIGEQKTLHLADGSTVYLNTDTAIDVSFDQRERRILLLQGEAEFAVAHDRNRPFRVTAGNTTTEAIGTHFAVHYSHAAGDVTLLEGAIRVTHRLANTENADHAVLKPGDHVAFNEQRLGAVQGADLTITDAWRRGRVVMNFVPLQDVVAEINRYRRGRVLLLDSELGQRKIHVAMKISQIDDWLDALEETLPLRVRHLGPVVLLQAR